MPKIQYTKGVDRTKIAKMAAKSKGITAAIERRDIFLVALIVLVGSAGFGLGRLSVIEGKRAPVEIQTPAAAIKATAGGASERDVVDSGAVVGSANSDVYHFPWCSGAQRINPENTVTFDSISEAKAAGYRPAKNCKGLK